MKSLLLSTALILITLTGLILNGYILLVIILTKQIKSANHILLLHLGVIEICIGLIFLVFFIPGANGKEWSSTGAPCLVHGFLLTLLQPLTLWTICGINCDRFYLIAVPLHYNRIVTLKKVFIGLVSIWIVSIILSACPILTNIPYVFVPRFGVCEPNFNNKSELVWYSTVYTAFTLLLPITFIIICNIKIFMIARYHRHRIASAIYQVAISAQVAITHQKNPFSWSFGRMATPPAQITGPKFHNALHSMLQFVGSFTITYVPYYSVILFESFIHTFDISDELKIFYKKYSPSFIKASSLLMLLSIGLNGFLYGVKSQSLKQILKNYWRKKQTTHDLNLEIQARTPSTCGSRRPSFLVKPENLIDVNKIMNKSPFHSPNTLQVPSNNTQGVSIVTEDEIYYKLKLGRRSSAFKFLHDMFGKEDDSDAKSKTYIPLTCSFEHKNSPKIMLTKASSNMSISSLDTAFNKEESSSSFRPLLGMEDHQEINN